MKNKLLFNKYIDSQKDICEFIAANYGHLIPCNVEITGNEFAVRIGEQYDVAEPHNHYAVEIAAEMGGFWSRKMTGLINWRK